MNNLVELDLHWRFDLPLELMAKISKLKQVRKLSVTHGLGYFGDIGGMDNLTELNVSWNGIKGCDDTQPIVKLQNLVKLNISRNNLSNKGAKLLSKLVNLTDLDISNNSLDDLSYLFSKMKNLTVLDVSENRLSPFDVESISELVQLTDLDISDNREIGEEGAISISGMKQLRILKFRDIELGEAAKIFSQMDNLTQLDISGNFIDDKGIKLISGMQNLTYLDASWNDITDAGVKIICENMPNLTSIFINENPVEEKGCNMLSSFKKWKNLNY
ncbi:predicted protein [Naegleria gruberi]|uniref:Predicted protein n=1 Tax=Naegleria gruberi TaxID=5762 RepID=D2VUK0_NAEGR|nr:uncharacterized protein NAEGRDRAFT_72690 [Naegleria gruberi]EFC39524.1 predicted protein [Naegleria gruberi]|eukprot:XP_002672268.1 predicted protein [Naegleria gruberi strain NEG-M]